MHDEGITILMLGDVVGSAGLAALERVLPGLIDRYGADLVTANGENAAIFGITEQDARRMLAAGVDVITGGNHTWEKREFWSFMDGEQRVLRPANYPSPASGRGFVLIEKGGCRFLVINLQGREYMTPVDCPFRTLDKVLLDVRTEAERDGEAPPCLVLLDFHAESTREKEALGFYVDGRVSVFAGTHTHVQTADEKILPERTAYISDLGMTGVLDSIIGMDKAICMERARKQIAYPLRGAEGLANVQGICVRLTKSGKALSIKRFSVA
ncbi:MAG: YmdB family metallophosphoesterase [Spirochaetaceae bacterium]|jgi:metallophosphoesterase (TIGR00282 family)|nr:YmdB family metallophosphoesterase [Spirochaetaceae bacterium]